MNATAVMPPKKNKQYDTVYDGGATILSVEPTDLRFTDGLTEEEAANGFLIAFTLKPDDERLSNVSLELEFSDRECRGQALAGKKQKEATRDDLFRHKLIGGVDAASADVSEVFDAAVVGKKIQIRIVDVTDPNKAENNVKRQVYLSNRPATLSPAERARRIAALTGRPVPAATPAQPAQAAAPVTTNPF